MTELPKVSMPDIKGGPVTFFKEVKAELFKVIWPSKEDVVKLTIVVVTVSAIIGLYVGGLDFLFTKLTDLVLKR